MTRRFSDWDLDCKVYIGSISTRTTKDDIESLFSKYGPLRNVWIARNPPGFAFVEYEDRRDAEEAVAELDGVRLCGQRIRVEMSHGKHVETEEVIVVVLLLGVQDIQEAEVAVHDIVETGETDRFLEKGDKNSSAKQM